MLIEVLLDTAFLEALELGGQLQQLEVHAVENVGRRGDWAG